MMKGAKGRANCEVEKVGIVGGFGVGFFWVCCVMGGLGGTNGSGPSTESEHCCDGFGCEVFSGFGLKEV